MQNQRNVNAVANSRRALKIKLRFGGVKAVRGTDGDGQRINTGTSDKFAGLFGVGIERIFSIDHQIVFNSAQTAQLGFNAGIIAVAQLHHAFTSATFSSNGE